LPFPQADVECNIFMEIQVGFVLKELYCLKLWKNVYKTKQARRVWNKHANKGLLELGYEPSIIDPCLYYQDKTVFMIYVDDRIFAGLDWEEIEQLFKELQAKYSAVVHGIGVHCHVGGIPSPATNDDFNGGG
jgi:hypothetical protein